MRDFKFHVGLGCSISQVLQQPNHPTKSWKYDNFDHWRRIDEWIWFGNHVNILSFIINRATKRENSKVILWDYNYEDDNDQYQDYLPPPLTGSNPAT